MEEMLNAAFNKFDMWQARRMSRKTWWPIPSHFLVSSVADQPSISPGSGVNCELFRNQRWPHRLLWYVWPTIYDGSKVCCQLDEVIGFARNHNCATMDDDLTDSCDDQPSVTGAKCVASLMKWLDLREITTVPQWMMTSQTPVIYMTNHPWQEQIVLTAWWSGWIWKTVQHNAGSWPALVCTLWIQLYRCLRFARVTGWMKLNRLFRAWRGKIWVLMRLYSCSTRVALYTLNTTVLTLAVFLNIFFLLCDTVKLNRCLVKKHFGDWFGRIGMWERLDMCLVMWQTGQIVLWLSFGWSQLNTCSGSWFDILKRRQTLLWSTCEKQKKKTRTCKAEQAVWIGRW